MMWLLRKTIKPAPKARVWKACLQLMLWRDQDTGLNGLLGDGVSLEEVLTENVSLNVLPLGPSCLSASWKPAIRQTSPTTPFYLNVFAELQA